MKLGTPINSENKFQHMDIYQKKKKEKKREHFNI